MPSRWTATTSSRAPGDLALVVAAHGRDELHILRRALEADLPYVGLVASPKRGTGVLAELRGDGVPGELLARIDVPAGLDIGARTPAEIALSILAKIVAVRREGAITASARRPAGASSRLRRRSPIDPICGMTVAAVATTPSLEHDGETIYFCCEGCKSGSGRSTAMPARDGFARKVTGEAEDEVRERAPDIETLARELAEVDYLVDEGLATSLFLGVRLPQPLLLEGEAGVGKTEAAKALATVLGTPLDPPAVLRGHRRRRGAVRVELPAPAAQHPARRRRRLGAARGGSVRPGLPHPPAAAARARASRARGPRCC